MRRDGAIINHERLRHDFERLARAEQRSTGKALTMKALGQLCSPAISESTVYLALTSRGSLATIWRIAAALGKPASRYVKVGGRRR